MSVLLRDGPYIIMSYEYANSSMCIRDGSKEPGAWVVGLNPSTNPPGIGTSVWYLQNQDGGFSLKNVTTGHYLDQGTELWQGNVTTIAGTKVGIWNVYPTTHPGEYQIRGHTSKTGVLELTGPNDSPIVIADNTNKGSQMFFFGALHIVDVEGQSH